MVEINTENFESWLDDKQPESFNKEKLADLIADVLSELNLNGVITKVNVDGPQENRAVLFRKPEWPTDSSEVNLEIYVKRYLERPLLLHEFGHEADRRNPSFGWKKEDDVKSKDLLYPFINLAWNISLDSRLYPNGLTQEERFKEYRTVLDDIADDYSNIFHESWNSRLSTYDEILKLAKRLQEISTISF